MENNVAYTDEYIFNKLEAFESTENFLLELCEHQEFIESHPEVIDITKRFQDMLGKLYDSGMAG